MGWLFLKIILDLRNLCYKRPFMAAKLLIDYWFKSCYRKVFKLLVSYLIIMSSYFCTSLCKDKHSLFPTVLNLIELYWKCLAVVYQMSNEFWIPLYVFIMSHTHLEKIWTLTLPEWQGTGKISEIWMTATGLKLITIWFVNERSTT